MKPDRRHLPGTLRPLGLCLALLGASCLPDDPAVKGRLLYPGISIERPEFHDIGGDPWVLFEVRQARPEPGKGGRLAVHLVNWSDPTQHRVLLPSRAERPEWPRPPDGSGAFFYMTDERLPTEGLRLPVGTLLRVRLNGGLNGGVVESIPDVMSYALHGSGQKFYYRKHRPGATSPELHLRDLQGRDRELGLLTGQIQFVGPEKMYFITGEDQTMTRLLSFDGEPQKLRNRVSRFLLHPSERFAIVSVNEPGKAPRSLILDLQTLAERPLPLDNPSNWMELRGETFVFSDVARGEKPAELHFFEIGSGSDRVFTLPPGVPGVNSLMGRPPEYREALAIDGNRGVTVFRPEAQPPFQTTSLRPSAPSFTPDGRYLIFLVPEPPPPPPAVSVVVSGKLFAQDTSDWTAPARLLSPKGASVPVEPVGYRMRPGETAFPLLFWARYGLGGSDLYLSNHESGAFMKVAEGIGAVAVGERHILGVVRISQDLTGDLVFRDFVDGREQLVEHGVADMQILGHQVLGDLVAFVVRERMTSSRRNGLWATKLVPLPEPSAARRNGVSAAAGRFFGGQGGVTRVRPE